MPNLTPLIFLLLTVAGDASFSPSTHIYLDCGSTTTTTIPVDSRPFAPDAPYLTPSNSPTLTATSTSGAGDYSSLYTTARLFTSTAIYRLPVVSSATHVLRLHFFPFSSTLSAARFDVHALQRFQLLQNFSTSSLTIKEYFLWADGGQDLVLQFQPSPNSSFISAIELFTAPAELIPNTTFGFQQAMETVHRLNVGGPKVTPFNDTLWRTWLIDDAFLVQPSFSLFNSTPLTSVQYNPPMVTQEVAPETVYGTARTMNITETMRATSTFNFNVTWSLPVVSGYRYLVRLHFCDIISPAEENVIIFDVYVGSDLAFGDFRSRGNADLLQAFYKEWSGDVQEKFINVSIGTSSKNSDNTANAYLNGLEVFKVNNSASSLDGITNSLYGTNQGKHGVPLVVLVPSIVGGLVLIVALIVLLVIVKKKYSKRSQAVEPKDKSSSYSPMTTQMTHSADMVTPTATPRHNFNLQIPLSVIMAATKGFDEELVIGKGGFGKVYKGVLEDGTEVAVKRGSASSKQGYPEFQTEITLLSQIRHKHLVALIGYCDEQSERILVYEYMEKGPLQNYLYGSTDKPCLSWKQRLEICIDAAKGIHYLHTGFDSKIIHRDLKSTNILLDKDYMAKVSDFGLSKLGPTYGETHVTTAVKGTFGYIDPEYFRALKLTEKSDVYSFGVMLFEVLCARPVIEPDGAREQQNLAEWAVHWHRRGQLEKIIDPRIIGEINNNSLRSFAEIAMKCLADLGIDRPTFGDILWNLEYALKSQETEVRRGFYEDSGAVETDTTIAIPMMSIPSISNGSVDNSMVTVTRMSEPQAGLGESSVFSQLVIDEGR